METTEYLVVKLVDVVIHSTEFNITSRISKLVVFALTFHLFWCVSSSARPQSVEPSDYQIHSTH